MVAQEEGQRVWGVEGLVGEACASLSIPCVCGLLENFPIHIYRENDGWMDRGGEGRAFAWGDGTCKCHWPWGKEIGFGPAVPLLPAFRCGHVR